jgi:hypothetical protein
VPNGYDRWDLRFREVSDQSTVQERERRLNHRINSAPRQNSAPDEPMASKLDALEQLGMGL